MSKTFDKITRILIITLSITLVIVCTYELMYVEFKLNTLIILIFSALLSIVDIFEYKRIFKKDQNSLAD